ncbi:TetR/AcrR family transcriptional regulator [Rhizobium panacihumi]|uniref:TetR/AcrR family transcriptional regulator n=1 Tax=Rhizobium panacihumi TaxID=2008450 RepID=UPI003D7A8F36
MEANKPSGRSPNDPERRDRIIEAALVTIAKLGVADTSHRRIAEVAGVPLGSLTYYFKGLDDIIGAAFERLAEQVSGRFTAVLRGARNKQEAKSAIVSFLSEVSERKHNEMVLSYELYAYASRRPALKPIMLSWMAASRTALEAHFTPAQARVLDAMIEGVTIHNATSPSLIGREEVEDLIEKLSQ